MSVLPHPSEHPVVTGLRLKRAEDLQLRIADAITAFAGSMHFVYMHIVRVRRSGCCSSRGARGRR